MSENTLQVISIFKLLWIVGFTAFYGFGGISNKWLRRFVGSFWMGIGIYGFSSWLHTFHLWYLLYPILLCASLHIGYGADTIGKKILRRSIYGFAVGISAIPLLFGNYNYLLFIYHVILCVLSSVLLGAFNPTKNARDEESLIATLSTVCVLYLI